MPPFENAPPYYMRRTLRTWYNQVEPDLRDPELLWGDFWKRFNTVRIPVLPEEEYFERALEIAKSAKDRGDYEKIFEERNARDWQELLDLMSETTRHTLYHHDNFPCDDAWRKARKASQTGSLMEFVRLLKGVAFGWEADEVCENKVENVPSGEEAHMGADYTDQGEVFPELSDLDWEEEVGLSGDQSGNVIYHGNFTYFPAPDSAPREAPRGALCSGGEGPSTQQKSTLSGAIRESTASSLTHSSDGHAAEAQETVQEEVPISTSFAANLPDRQVVEADALTPPPPLTITTPRSSVLTHVTGTQVIEARREDNQPLRAGSTSHAASMQEVAAAASSSPEVRTVSRSTELPKQDDERQSEIGKEMINVSATVPSARLIIAYNRRFIAGDDELSKDVVRHPRTASGWDLISVVQGAKHADFVLNLSYHNRPVDEAVGRFIPFSLSLQIIFQPASDSCVLSNRGGAKFHLEHLEASCSCARNSIDSMQCHVLLPGMWRILTRGEKPHEDEEYSLVQWLILPRKFCASVDGESTKRQKLSGTNLVRRHQDMEVLVKDLEDGQSARIRRVPGDTADYELRRIEHIASTASACVFACRHSKVAGALAIKVIDYDVNSVNQFNRRAAAHLTTLVAAWKREVSFLRSLKHKHIVSLKAFDGRLLALFLEHLPPSLDRGRTIKLDSVSAKAILLNISSALVYLEEKGIVHHDIKPHNIAHSPARGAVLLDFGQAATAKSYGPHGGTPAFLPPELFDAGARGHSGDVWAFGVTMLYVLGKTSMPSLRLDVPLRSLYRCNPLPQVQELMKSVALLREGLSQEDGVERLVSGMLDPNAAARATAKSLVSALRKLEC
ncbi:kinase-like protein [Trichoderma reesei RUT C-30]|uniref:Kinase-like protein n=1 Tax=Hypocrea jecorina (strain ATCC 56765 / BCRC 32924 / NRRL 11460 / Rut C-30) TaxID=1344414 RepID=A0A024SM21_HYPJR|nr:kinase-like protein [Trichoderma reesei RUT C-30]